MNSNLNKEFCSSVVKQQKNHNKGLVEVIHTVTQWEPSFYLNLNQQNLVMTY